MNSLCFFSLSSFLLRAPPLLLLLLIFAKHFHVSSAAAATPPPLQQGSISPGWSLAASNSTHPLTSPHNNFSLGFTCSSQTHCYLSISYSNLDNAIVWMANRDKPVTTAASLQFTEAGQLVLSDPSIGNSLWTTDTVGRNVVTAEMQDNGSLVLQDTDGNTVWRSFDEPTDTLLPEQAFQTTLSLVSDKNAIVHTSGRYRFIFNSSFLGLHDDVTGTTYWTITASTFTGGQLQSSGIFCFNNSDTSSSTCYYPSDIGTAGAIRRLKLDADGNLRTYSWNYSSSSWSMVWTPVFEQCSAIPELCGPYGVCIYDPAPVCVCPPGFKVKNRQDLSQGCVANVQLICDTNITYVELDHTDFPFNDYYVNNVSLADCLQLCSSDCRCLGAAYSMVGDRNCRVKNRILNGRGQLTGDARFYLKVSASDPSAVSPHSEQGTTIWGSVAFWQQIPAPCEASVPALAPVPPASDPGPSSRETKQTFSSTAVLTLLLVTVGELLCFGTVSFYILRKKDSKIRDTPHGASSPHKIEYGSPAMFTFKELELATNNFSEMLGSGGFGSVYKGHLADGRAIAVKRLEGLSQREKQFQAEVAVIAKVYHKNVVGWIGCCAEGDQRLVVYEYMENGSLDKLLFHPSDARSDGRTLDWKNRFNISLGTAHGLAYLHEECSDGILHCDIKPQNILLDKNFCPKVADFGLSYLFTRDHTLNVSTIRGTRGYLAPEWLLNHRITPKADVFSFGMLLLELVSGRSNYDFTPSQMTADKWFFPEWAHQKMSENLLQEVIDPAMARDVNHQEVIRVLNVAFWCIQQDMNARPSMERVARMLEGVVEIAEPPAPKVFDL